MGVSAEACGARERDTIKLILGSDSETAWNVLVKVRDQYFNSVKSKILLRTDGWTVGRTDNSGFFFGREDSLKMCIWNEYC